MHEISTLRNRLEFSQVTDLDGAHTNTVTWLHTPHQKLCSWSLSNFCKELFKDRAASEKGVVYFSLSSLLLLTFIAVLFALSLGRAQAKKLGEGDKKYPFLSKTTRLVFEAESSIKISRQNENLKRGDGLSLDNWLTVSANLDYSYSRTNFFRSGHNAALFEWDSRIEFWMPPFRNNFSWGPYIRMAGITSNRYLVWGNAWLAKPGFGMHVFPFSHHEFRENASAKILGHVCLFSEYNRLDYWGSENIWRPDEQVRIGIDHWKALHVNNIYMPWWTQVWTGLTWESANEFDKDYNTVIFANSLRLGWRQPGAGILSMFSPYILLESSLTNNEKYYWENRLIGGAGVRFAPFLYKKNTASDMLGRLVIFAEWQQAIAYYRDSPPSVPGDDFVLGFSMNIGSWYK